MSEFKTRSEIAGASEFIQYLEKLRSGSLASSQGTNRTLQRLAENADALLQRVQQLNFGQILFGGTWSLSGTTLSFSSNITLMLFGELGQAAQTSISSAASPIVFPGSGSVAYVVVDRASGGLIGSVQVALSGNYITAISGQDDRLDYVIIAWYDVAGVTFADGRKLRDGESLTNNGFTDTQYGQQTELTLVRENQKENLNLNLTGGGDITWDTSTLDLTWSGDFRLMFPASSGRYNRILGAGSVNLPPGRFWYATVSRDPAGIIDVSTGVATQVPDTDDTFVLAYHNDADSRVYLADGTALSDAETVKLGGVRIGVQWYYKEVGTSTLTLDFAAALGPATSYRVGSGELMVYRNGIKAIASKAFWSGTYPAGALDVSNGAISPGEDYIEEDQGDGSGTRIHWLEDDAGPPIEHPSGTHDPPMLWPDSDDIIEGFIGNQGQAPIVTVPDGIYGFEVVWCPTPSAIRTQGGYLVSGGIRYTSDSSALEVTTSDMIGSETLTASTWHYVYLGPGTSPGSPPDIKLSTSEPEPALTGPGVHPDFTDYRFLASVFVGPVSTFFSFTKSGSEVYAGKVGDVSSAFSGLTLSGGWELVSLAGNLPAGIPRVRLRIQATAQAAVPAGNRLPISFRSDGFAGSPQTLYAVKPANSNEMEYVVDLVLNGGNFEISIDSADFQNIGTADVIAYSEGRHTSGQGLL